VSVFPSLATLNQLQDVQQRIRAEVRKVLIGQENLLDLLLATILANGHALIEGVPGVAKTLTAKLVARTLSIQFSRIQFTPDLMPSDVTGTTVYNARAGQFEFKPGPIFSNLVLIDEINRAPAKTQAALFEVMEERQVTADGQTYTLNPPFFVFATQNPVEHEGTYRLPEAQLDRFLFLIEVGYPDVDQEAAILQGHHARAGGLSLDSIAPVITGDEVLALQNLVRSLHIDTNLIQYIAQVVHQTRVNKSLFLGASPRASIAILQGSKAIAALQGRDFVIPDDIRRVTVPALKHRILLTPEREMQGVTPEKVIEQLLAAVEVPR
jgi:MoxR-like ATPase